jgi:hypothetical protein
MAIQYRWEFPSLGVTYHEGMLTNVISTSYFNLIAEEDGVSVYMPGSINLAAPNPASFTPYDQVTQEQVQAWTEEAIGPAKVTIYKEKLAAQLQKKINPTSGPMTPPWSA